MRYSYSAGGVVVNPRGQVVLVHQRGVAWSLPKGHVHSNESSIVAAKREIWEETGLTSLVLVKELGRYTRYKIGKRGKGENRSEFKMITMFFFRTRSVRLAPKEDDVSEAKWFDLKRAIRRLTHPRDRKFLRRHAKEVRELIATQKRSA